MDYREWTFLSDEQSYMASRQIEIANIAPILFEQTIYAKEQIDEIEEQAMRYIFVAEQCTNLQLCDADVDT
jgi:hypothetical protein